MSEQKPFYPTLEAEISRRGLKKSGIAKRLEITPRAFSQKLTGKTDFWWKEISIISALIPDIPIDQLFSH